MAKIYNHYKCNVDHTWYDSSNIIYSECFDSPDYKSLKIVFKGGRTYLYKDVDPMDYLLFRDGESNGKIFNSKIKNLPCTKLEDTNLEKLEELKQEFIQFDNTKEKNYHLEIDEITGNFNLYINNVLVYKGVEGFVSIINLLKSIGIQYSFEKTEVSSINIDKFENEPIV